jgi:hypothetical protein
MALMGDEAPWLGAVTIPITPSCTPCLSGDAAQLSSPGLGIAPHHPLPGWQPFRENRTMLLWIVIPEGASRVKSFGGFLCAT